MRVVIALLLGLLAVACASTTDGTRPRGRPRLVARASGVRSIALSWEARDAFSGRLWLERRGPFASKFTRLLQASATTLGYTDVSLASDTRYEYRLVAPGASGEVSLSSNEVSASTASGPRGFSLEPVPGESRIRVKHEAFPGGEWTLCVPEYGFYSDRGFSHELTDVVWTRDPQGEAWRFRWGATAEVKAETGIDFEGRVSASDDHLDVTLTATNAGEQPWSSPSEKRRLFLFCFRGPLQPGFWDEDAERTYVRLPDAFVRLCDVMNHQFESHRMWGPSGKGGAWSRLAVRSSTNGEWVCGIATDRSDGNGVGFNFNHHTSCIHSNPAWPPLGPRESATVRCRVYLQQGTPADLWESYERDWGPWP